MSSLLPTQSRPSSSSFFFSRCGAHRDLHSFPTRRSSDLGRDRLHRLHTVSGPRIRHGSRHGTREVGVRAGRILGDRKSTRLNSSHVEISYAVFCLKKKKKEKH